MIVGCFANFLAKAQDTYQFGALPAINLNFKLQDGWSTNYKLESRQLFQKGTFGETASEGYQYVLTDNTFILAKKVGLNSRVAGGYLFRYREGEVIHRTIQQFAITRRLIGLRLSHRVVTDQTFAPQDPAEFRLRYRAATEIPLNGQEADPKELYLKLSNEYLNSLEGSEYDLEIRLIPLLGYTTIRQNRIEAGLDYRVNSFLDKSARHTFWVSVNYYIVFD
jgi:hypothetical protein